MPKSVFKELFGELEEENEVRVDKVNLGPTKSFKLLLVFFLAIIVLCLTLIITLLFLAKDLKENLDGNYILNDFSNTSAEFNIENSFDLFLSKLLHSTYKVDDKGAFAYVYEILEDGDSVKKDGFISIGEGYSEFEDYTYFQNGRIALFDVGDNKKVLWDENDRKHILLESEKKYFIVKDNSDFYYRIYLGQHILQDLIDDYLKNKDFITPISENKWAWEWSFYTPVDYLNKYTMDAEIFFDEKTGYLEEIRLLDGNKEICVYEFKFERKEEHLNVVEILEDYEKVSEEEINSLL